MADDPLIDPNARVVLSAGNITHYHHAATALYDAGILHRYVFSYIPSAASSSWLTSRLPAKYRSRAQSRELVTVPSSLIRTAEWSEFIKRVPVELGWISPERGNWAFNELYDTLTRKWATDATVFHFVSGVGLHGARASKKRGALVICDVRSAYPDSEWREVGREHGWLRIPYQPVGKLYDKRVKQEFALADYFIVPSEYVARTFLEHGFAESRLFVLPYGVNVDQFVGASARQKDNVDRFRIIYVGRVIPGKGVQYLLDAFVGLDLPNCELMVIGHIDETMRAFCADYAKRDDRIKFVGSVSHADLPRIYSSGAVFALPSVSEGSALVVYEAMASGLPVITTTNGGSVVRDGIEGFVIPTRDVGAIRDKLHWLYKHPDERLVMGQVAISRALEFSWDQYGQRLIDIYSRILTQP